MQTVTVVADTPWFSLQQHFPEHFVLAALVIVYWLSYASCSPVPHTCPDVQQTQCRARLTGTSLTPDDAPTSAATAAPSLRTSWETRAQQDLIIARLKALAAADTAFLSPNSPEAAAAGEDAAILSEPSDSMQSSLQQQQTLPITLDIPSLQDSVPASKANAARTKPSEDGLTFIRNRKYKIGVDLQRAGVIKWISSSRIPGPMRDQNLINTWDAGRLLQQSFYGCPDGSCWATKPWVYNPVQAGSWNNQPSITTRHVVSRNNIYVEGHPRNWGGENVIYEVTFASNITLKQDYVQVKFSIRYTGHVTHRLSHQEVPAVFLQRGLSVLTYYADRKPWTHHGNVTYAFPGFPNMYAKPTEAWAAYLDPNTGWGFGLYNPKASTGITAYRVGPDGSTAASDCSYFSPLITAQLIPGMKDYSYTVTVAVGSLNSMRRTFTKIEQNRRRKRGKRRAAGAGAAIGVIEGPQAEEQSDGDQQSQEIELYLQTIQKPQPGHRRYNMRTAERGTPANVAQ